MTAAVLQEAERRQFMAKTVNELGRGGQSRAERELGWNRGLIRKGRRELESGVTWLDGFKQRERKRVESRLPNLLDDITSIVDGQSQTDPQFQNNRLYTRLSTARGRRKLIETKSYYDEELPSEETLRVRLNRLGYCQWRNFARYCGYTSWAKANVRLPVAILDYHRLLAPQTIEFGA